MMCVFGLLALAANRATPLMARLFDSVAPDVKKISLECALIRRATWLRASSTAS
jgi:hypothetical protein